ncbi:hypothetical protein FGO68_gene4171 [Halteria grandinella]|uniref:Mic1 domain-containing protein n=1 Tax=Halteria grandinella TaxID=5974 RepID=A0A8J8P0R4_HALGN|nr:hypothetical protein FGO68_gene4171 [Halteria grandinella]
MKYRAIILQYIFTMDLNCLITDKHPSPFRLVHFTNPSIQPTQQSPQTKSEDGASSYLSQSDVFFDSFSNTLTQYTDGQFVIQEMHDAKFGLGTKATKIHLQAHYQKINALAVHPSKRCLALSLNENVLTLLFFSDDAAEEVKLTFSKAKVIHAFTFCGGTDDFNFFVVTNLSIDIYRVDIAGMKARIVKNIALELPTSCTDPQIYVEPLTATVVAIDAKSTTVYPYFLHLQEQGPQSVRGQSFKLDLSQVIQSHKEAGGSSIGLNDSVMNDSRASMASQSRPSARASIALKARQLLSGAPKASQLFPGGKVPFTPYTGNKNLLHIKQALDKAQYQQPYLSENYVPKRGQHQVLLSTVYNKVVMFHMAPLSLGGAVVTLYELDPSFSYKNQQTIPLTTFNGAQQLLQMQLIENLLVVHNMDEQTTQCYDLKLGSTEYTECLLKDHLTIDVSKVKKGRTLGYYLQKDEKASNDDGYKLIDEVIVQEAEEAKVVTDQTPETTQQTTATTEDGSSLIDTTQPTTTPESPPATQPYDENTTIYVEPMYLLSLHPGGVTHCMTLHLSLRKLCDTAVNSGKCLLALINRQRNKALLLSKLKESLVNQSLSLLDASKIFYRLAAIYKQASVERQAVKRREVKDAERPLFSAFGELMSHPAFEATVQQWLRLSRLRACTALSGTWFNQWLMEYATPAARVLSGEVIVFQNELIEIFKHLILQNAGVQQSRLRPVYITGALTEFLRSLMEHQIPQQPVLQNLLIKHVLDNKDYNAFHQLLQYHVLTENLELARTLVNLGSNEARRSQHNAHTFKSATKPEDQKQESDDEDEADAPPTTVGYYYEPAYQSGLDMLKKLKSYEEIVVALINEGLTLRALNFAQQYNVHSMKLSSFLECVEMLREEGRMQEAEVLMKRITEVRKYDQVKGQTEGEHMAILVEE